MMRASAVRDEEAVVVIEIVGEPVGVGCRAVGMARRHWVAVLVVLLAACGGMAGQSPSPSEVQYIVQREVRTGDYLLRIEAPRLEWSSAEAIELNATLTYVGPEAGTHIVGSGSGPVGFSVTELDGDRRMAGVGTADCHPYDLPRKTPIVEPYSKSIGFSAGDPHAAFYEAFAEDPQFHLPPGRWRVDVAAQFSVGECGGRNVDLRTSVILTVE
jgi:hypothetical protein